MGCQGRISDGGVFKNSDLYRALENGSLSLPKPSPFPKTGDHIWDEDDYPDIPYVIVGDNAFQLSNYMTKPYSKRFLDDDSLVYNYRVSRLRRVSENCFGIFVARFRLFLSGINLKMDNVIYVVLAAVVLHNMLCEKSRPTYMPNSYIDHEDPESGIVTEGEWRNDVPQGVAENLKPIGCRGSRSAEKIGECF